MTKYLLPTLLYFSFVSGAHAVLFESPELCFGLDNDTCIQNTFDSEQRKESYVLTGWQNLQTFTLILDKTQTQPYVGFEAPAPWVPELITMFFDADLLSFGNATGVLGESDLTLSILIDPSYKFAGFIPFSPLISNGFLVTIPNTYISSYELASVPVPASLALFCLGLVAFGLSRKLG